MAVRVYPEWVQKQRTKGTTVKKIGENYYLYKHSSKRVPGKKNPVPNDTYIGRITPTGIIRSGQRKVDVINDDVIVKEYGFSRSVELLCTPEWKNIQGESWHGLLSFILSKDSPETYLYDDIPENIDPHFNYGAQKKTLFDRIKKAYGIKEQELKSLSTIYLVTIGKNRMVSKISEDQQKVLDHAGIDLEVS